MFNSYITRGLVLGCCWMVLFLDVCTCPKHPLKTYACLNSTFGETENHVEASTVKTGGWGWFGHVWSGSLKSKRVFFIALSFWDGQASQLLKDESAGIAPFH